MKTAWYSLVKEGVSEHAVRKTRQQAQRSAIDRDDAGLAMVVPPGRDRPDNTFTHGCIR
jgi:hypothetical protein